MISIITPMDNCTGFLGVECENLDSGKTITFLVGMRKDVPRLWGFEDGSDKTYKYKAFNAGPFFQVIWS